MARLDLLNLTDDGLVQLANAGLVKRALKELAAGQTPQLQEGEDGAITALYADGTRTVLKSGQFLKDASCTCPSYGLCRHRVMLVVAYRAQFAHHAPQGEERASNEQWDPGELDVQAFEQALGASAKAELKRLLGASLPVFLTRGRTPSARLPMATVRFLVPRDITYARCDCLQESGCVHVALAVRAFRASNGQEHVNVGQAAAPLMEQRTNSLQLELDRVVERLIDVGVTAGSTGHAQTLGAALHQAQAVGATQALLALNALKEQIDAYDQRNARYDESAVLGLAAELYARTRASDAAAALGLGEAFETQMTRSRLVSLGVRLRAIGADRQASVLVADSDTGATMVLDKVFVAPKKDPSDPNAPPPQRLGVANMFLSNLALASLGHGQMITSVAKRRADGLLTLGRGTGGKTQLMPRDAIVAFNAPLAANSISEIAQLLNKRPISLVRQRQRVENVHVFDVEEVMGQSWSVGAQLWQAAVRVRGEEKLLYLERTYDAAAPSAISVLTAAFAGKLGPLRQISGPVRLNRDDLVCEPWSLGADRFIVPDTDEIKLEEDHGAPLQHDASFSLFDQANGLLSAMVHAGNRCWDGASKKVAQGLARELEGIGFVKTAAHINKLIKEPKNTLESFGQAAIWLLAMNESL